MRKETTAALGAVMPQGAARATFPSWPHYADDERAEVDRVLRSGKVNYWTGEEGRQFESEYAASLGVRHAIALANGTVALELAVRCLDIGPGDEVVVTPRSFIASTSVAVLNGAVPVFADVDPDSQNITAQSIRAVLTPRTRAVIPVHLAGWPCDMDAIMELARERNLKVIEDCAQANGALWRGRPVGTFGHAAAFSFCQDKIITTGGEGGLLATNDTAVWERCWSFKDHGKNREAAHLKAPGTEFRWLHDGFGSNYRMTEPQAVIGRRQLQKLSQWHRQRERNAQCLHEALHGLPALRVPMPGPEVRHAWYRFYMFLRPEFLKPEWPRQRILGEITAQGVPCFVGSCPEIYLERAFEGTGWRPQQRLPVAQQLGETALCLLVHPTLEQKHVNEMGRIVAAVVASATA